VTRQHGRFAVGALLILNAPRDWTKQTNEAVNCFDQTCFGLEVMLDAPDATPGTSATAKECSSHGTRSPIAHSFTARRFNSPSTNPQAIVVAIHWSCDNDR